MTAEPIPVWLDCDPGNDDAFAILLSIFDSRFDLLGISTVHGNVSIDKTTQNTLGLLDFLQVYNINVYEGSETPLYKTPRFATHIHGNNGIGGMNLPKHTKNQLSRDKHYLDAMKDAILQHENKICLCITGAMTNLSKLISKYPIVKSKIKYISVMGGAFGFGNITQFSEFNFHVDPHATRHVLNEIGDKIILSPLNLTHQVIANEEIRQAIENKSHDSIVWKGFYDILMFYSNVYTKVYSLDGPPLHDPIALYSLLPFVYKDYDNYGYKYLRRRIDVVETGEKEGQSFVINPEIPFEQEEEGGVFIGQTIDVHKFWKSISLALKNAELHRNRIDE